MNTARFATVVAKAGRPTLHLTWLPVAKDAALKTALGTHRVMTVHQTMRGGQKDFGTVGFSKGPKTQILIFPKSLRRFAEQRIVGINYDLIADAAKLEPAKAVVVPRAARPPPAKVVKFSAPSSFQPAPTAPTAVRKRPVLPAVEIFPLTWEVAVKELDQIRRQIKGPTGPVTRLAQLSARMKEKLAPH